MDLKTNEAEYGMPETNQDPEAIQIGGKIDASADEESNILNETQEKMLKEADVPTDRKSPNCGGTERKF